MGWLQHSCHIPFPSNRKDFVLLFFFSSFIGNFVILVFILTNFSSRLHNFGFYNVIIKLSKILQSPTLRCPCFTLNNSNYKVCNCFRFPGVVDCDKDIN
uniref:Uncharacterized protein n=1 Tax=Rhizophora mucronata TaxID=61149 RepID=A0A2P2JBB4_RHIMU